MEKIIFETPKTLFDVMSGKKKGENLTALALFANCWSWQETAKGNAVFDANGRLVATDVDSADVAAGGIYYLERGGVFTLFAPDGKMLVEKAENILIYPNGWIEITLGGEKSLYRPDMSLAAQGYAEAQVMQDGFYYLTSDAAGKWTLFLRDGTKRHEGFVACEIVQQGFYLLDYGTNSVIYDDETQTETECTFGIIKFLAHKMFIGLKGQQLCLFRSTGEQILAGYDRYEAFANGMFAAVRQGELGTIFVADGTAVLTHVAAFREDDNADYVIAAADDRYTLFGTCGEVLFAGTGAVTVLTGGWFEIMGGELMLSTLHRPDKSIAVNGILGAEVYGNGWYQVEIPEDNSRSQMELYDDKGTLVAQSSAYIDFDETQQRYVLSMADGKKSLYDAKGELLLGGVDEVHFLGVLYAAAEGDMWTLYSAENSKLYAAPKDKFFAGLELCGFDDKPLSEFCLNRAS